MQVLVNSNHSISVTADLEERIKARWRPSWTASTII